MTRIAAVICLMLGVAVAQELTIDRARVKEQELPKGIRPAEGMPTSSRQPRAYFETPDVESLVKGGRLPKPLRGLIPSPVRKEHQSFHAKGGVPGSVFLFEFAANDLSRVLPFLRAYLWGDAGRSKKHPEELISHGRLVWILSFPRGDPAAEWCKQRLREKFRVPAPRDRREFAELGRKIAKAYDADDAETGMRLLKTHADKVKDWAFGHYCLGEFGVMAKNWKVAERGYRRALELHDTVVDPLEDHLVWAGLDGLGTALLFQKKLKASVETLRKATRFALAKGISETGQSSYNLACALALLEKWPGALTALRDAIKKDAAYRKHARTDEDLAKARQRKEFQELLR